MGATALLTSSRFEGSQALPPNPPLFEHLFLSALVSKQLSDIVLACGRTIMMSDSKWEVNGPFRFGTKCSEAHPTNSHQPTGQTMGGVV
jgi:hypothetical protein